MTDVAVMLTPAQVAERLGISTDAVYELCDEHAPEIGHHRFGRRIGIPEAEVEAYLKRTFRPAVVSLEEHRHRTRQVA